MAASYNVVSQLPQHIVDTYPQFADFLTQYYAFLNDDGNPENILSNILRYGDIDTTIDSFKEHILGELMGDIPDNIVADRALLAKHIKELYSKTGTEDSYRLLFRILFNKEIDVYYPVEQVLKPSNDYWKQDISFICHVADTVPVDTVKMAIDNNILVTIDSKILPVYVYDVVQLGNAHSGFNIFEFFIRKDFSDNFDTATTFTINKLSTISIINGGIRYKGTDTIEINGVNGGGAQATLTTTNGIITSVNLSNSGAGYINAPSISINSNTGVGAYLVATTETLYNGTVLISPSKIKVLRSATDYQIGSAYSIIDDVGSSLVIQVNELDIDGTVKNFSILQFGQYYPAKLYKTIDRKPTVAKMSCDVNVDGEIENVVVDFVGKNYTAVPTVTVIGDGVGAEITVSINGSGWVINPVIVNAGYGYTVPPAIILDSSSIAISSDNSKLRIYQGSYDKTVGSLSSDMAIYDGEYYQTFSYELIVSELFDDYKSVLKKLVHPASYAVWAAFDLQKVAQVQVNSYKIDIERASSFLDHVTIAESLPVFNVNKVLGDTDIPIIVDALSVAFTLTPLVESPTLTDDSLGFSINTGKTFLETMVSSDSIPIFDFGKNVTETTTSDETFAVDFVKDTIVETPSLTNDDLYEIDFVKGTIAETMITIESVPIFNVSKPIAETTTNTETFDVDFVKDTIAETPTLTDDSGFTPVLTTYTTDELQRGYWAGGITATSNSTQIDGIIFSTEASVNPSAGLSVARRELAGVNSTSHGYFGGGYSTSEESAIDGIRFGSEAAINSSTTLAVARQNLSGANSSTKGYFIGGGSYPGSVSGEIDGITFLTEAAINPSANLAIDRYNTQAVSSSTKGYIMAGALVTDFFSTDIEALTFSTETRTTLSATLGVYGQNNGAVNSSTIAYIFSQQDGLDFVTPIDKFTFSTETISHLTPSSLLQNRVDFAGVNSSTKGYIGGGDDWDLSVMTNNIQSIEFSSDTVATPSANLVSARKDLGSVSMYA